MDDRERRRLLQATGAILVLAIIIDLYAGGIPGAVGKDLGLILGLRFYSALGYVGILAGTYMLGRMLASRRAAWTAMVFAGASQLLNHGIIGWNHTVSTFVMVLATVLVIRYRRDGAPMDMYAVAALAGVGVWIRYPLSALFLPIVLAVVQRAHRDRSYGRLLLAGMIGVMMLVPVAGFQQVAYGDALTTAYELRPRALPPNNKPNLASSFDPSRLIYTVPSMLVRFDATSPVIDPDVDDFRYRYYKSSLLETSPYLILAVFGFFLLYHRDRGTALLFAGLSVIPVLLYGSWIYFSGGWTTNMRYLSPVIPLLSVLAAEAVPDIDPGGRWMAAGLVGVVALLGSIVDGLRETVALNVMSAVSLSIAVLLGAAALLQWSRFGDGRQATMFFTVVATTVGAFRVLYIGNVKLFYGATESMLVFNPAVSPIITAIGIASALYGAWLLNDRFM